MVFISGGKDSNYQITHDRWHFAWRLPNFFLGIVLYCDGQAGYLKRICNCVFTNNYTKLRTAVAHLAVNHLYTRGVVVVSFYHRLAGSLAATSGQAYGRSYYFGYV
jgi:hypothetical protein